MTCLTFVSFFKHTVLAARFSNYPGNMSWLPLSLFCFVFFLVVRRMVVLKRSILGGQSGGLKTGGRRGEWAGLVFWLVGSDVSGATSWSVCSLGGGDGDCSVVSLNKMAARPLSRRAHWTPTMSVRSAVWINTECISPESLLILHLR